MPWKGSAEAAAGRAQQTEWRSEQLEEEVGREEQGACPVGWERGGVCALYDSAEAAAGYGRVRFSSTVGHVDVYLRLRRAGADETMGRMRLRRQGLRTRTVAATAARVMKAGARTTPRRREHLRYGASILRGCGLGDEKWPSKLLRQRSLRSIVIIRPLGEVVLSVLP